MSTRKLNLFSAGYLSVSIATAVVVYLKFLLAVTAQAFYELYHIVKLDLIYWFYSGFKIASVYVAQWQNYNKWLLLLWVLMVAALYRCKVVRLSRP